MFFLSRSLLIALSGVSLALIVSCASSERNPDGTYPQSKPHQEMRDYDENSKAHPAAYVSDAMHIRRPMPSHSDWRPLEFYYKHCSQVDDGKVHWPKGRIFECTGPY